MKKSLLSVFTMVAMAAAFTACSNDDIDRASCSLGNGCYGK